MVRVGVVGSTGYAGVELVRLLVAHEEVEIRWLMSRTYAKEQYESVFQHMLNIIDMDCTDEPIEKLAEDVDVIFMATPQGYASGVITSELLSKVRVIDLSADFRFKDVVRYKEWYGIEHKSPQFIPEAVYGLTELHREEVKKARLLANPGCYTTCSILSLYPLVKEGLIDEKSIVISAMSGTSGAGRGRKTPNLFCEVNESVKAYAVATHRHTPEIEDQLTYAGGQEVILNFTPHLVPMNRGILVTAYANMNCSMTTEELRKIYQNYYDEEYFIRVIPDERTPETRWVKGSNFVDINVKVDERTGRVIALGALDNLTKGAAGQAVQNMNVMFGLKETMGIDMPPVFP